MALTDNLAAGFQLDEASGNALDVLLSNDLTANGSPGATTGKLSGCRTFNGSSQYFERADNATFARGDTDWHISVGIYWSGSGSFPIVLRKRAPSNPSQHNAYALYINTSSSNRLTWDVASSAGGAASAVWGTSISANTWYLADVWHDSVNNQIGIAVDNGTPVTTSWSNGIATSTSGTFQLGASTSQSLYWNGRLDEFYLWDRVLSSQERTDKYNGGSWLAYPWTVGGGSAGGRLVGRSALIGRSLLVGNSVLVRPGACL